MSKAASKADVEVLHNTFAKKLKDMLGEDGGESAAFLQVVRQFIRDQSVTCSTGHLPAGASAEECAEALAELEAADFPSFTQ